MSDFNIEKGAALAAALEQLFEQYPAEGRIEAGRWRRRAIVYAIAGDATMAFMWVRGTGVPGDVLDALEGLLNE